MAATTQVATDAVAEVLGVAGESPKTRVMVVVVGVVMGVVMGMVMGLVVGVVVGMVVGMVVGDSRHFVPVELTC